MIKNPQGFENVISEELGGAFPYLVVPGNHDMKSWPETCSGTNDCYSKVFAERYSSSNIPLTKEQLTSQMYSLQFQGIDLLVVGAQPAKHANAYVSYLATELSNNQHVWKICNWHKNQRTMQAGGKVDEMGWEVYDTCLQAGAIIATAHEHSYQRTKTLTAFHEPQGVVVNTLYPDPQQLFVYPGSTFVFVSGAGGHGLRNQERCLPKIYPYGCNGEWASIYTTNQQAKYGALFVEFNPTGNPREAQGYFKNIDNVVVDSFTVTAPEYEVPSPTPGPSVTPAPPAPNPDADGDDDVDIFDFNALLSVFGWSSCGHMLDLNSDCSINMLDYELFLEALQSWWG